MVTRLRVGGVTLAVRAAEPAPGLRLPQAMAPFIAGRGADIRLKAVLHSVPPTEASDLLFDSGGIWRAYRCGRGLLYTFRPPAGPGAPARGVRVDRRRRRGRLYLPSSPHQGQRGFALSYPLDELLFQHHIAWRGGLVVHACGVVLDGHAVLFLGRSGAGKTTTARLWRRHRPGTSVLSDDRLVLRRRRAGYWAWGTPWHGSGRFASPLGRPLAGLFFLEQSRETRCERLPLPDAAGRLFARSFPPPWERGGIARVLETCAAVARQVPCFLLRFRPDRTAVTEVLERLASRRSE